LAFFIDVTAAEILDDALQHLTCDVHLFVCREVVISGSLE
jgi:hypothetical protein